MYDLAIFDIIDRNPFFAGLARDHVEFLAERAKRRRVPRDSVLFRFGDRADRFYVIVSGKVSVEVAAIEGPPLELQVFEAGAVLGWSWLIPPYKWAFQARADEDSEVLEFDGVSIRARCESEPKFGYELVKRFAGLMSERYMFARRKMMDAWRPSGYA